ncbi:MAG: hypothetical protein O2985_09370, partial [Proteobacteria bacterium]|nr:hypothetical protein [Pseudomonadota bacterium]
MALTAVMMFRISARPVRVRAGIIGGLTRSPANASTVARLNFMSAPMIPLMHPFMAYDIPCLLAEQ